ncbi:uncharacterized protein UTRI_05483_B [Ustilago trichophora]|uniref:Chromatin modification-related protein EAF6 n=1 Tax=Ustilago trichophora TaxID=86804 RepID=A0A5C3ENV9_9BASI|nr:uncharacterized protein UTRI_05483_B [Ustilago trichophora]
MAPTATGNTASTGAAGTTTSTSAAATTSTPTTTTTTSAPTSLEEANQRYQSVKLALRTGLAHKRLIDRSLIDLESQIYLFEGSYLQSTSSSGGNIVKGFDSYLKNSSSSSGYSSTTGRGNNNSNSGANLADIPLEDRIFSLSSATYAKSLELKANEGLAEVEGREREGSVSATPNNKGGMGKKNGSVGTEEDAPSAGTGGKKSKKDKDSSSTSVATPGGGGGGGKEGTLKKKKDKTDAEAKASKDKERSSTPNLKTTGGKNTGTGGDAGSASGTPTKSSSGGGGKAMGTATATKLKRKNTDGVATPGGKVSKKKKDDD